MYIGLRVMRQIDDIPIAGYAAETPDEAKAAFLPQELRRQ